MTGENEPAPSLLHGFGRNVRRTLIKNGVSSAFLPKQAFHRASGIDPISDEALDDLDGSWNL